MILGPTLYGLAFAVLLPLLLLAWGAAARPQVSLPVPGSPALGLTLAGTGAILLLTGIASILRYGKGLPMNAYPPPRYVVRGAYRVLRHPIYSGFTFLVFGVAMTVRSSAGFWLVGSVTALGCAALVLGYERIDLQRRFGPSIHRPCLSLPPASDNRPSGCDRLSAYVLVLLPWLAVYEALALLGPPPDAVGAFLSFERSWPVLEWTEALYASTYLLVLLAPLVALGSRHLRAFALDGLVATGVAALVWIAVPLVAPPRPFEPSGPLGRLLLFERAQDVSSNAFPSFHVTWALLSARAFASRWPSAKPLWLALAGSIAASCVTTGMHGLADVAAGALLYLLVSRREKVWAWLRRGAERIANSWREWRIGPVRVIVHSVYAGLAGIFAVGGVGTLLGTSALPAALIIATLGVAFAALSAQWIEGSSKLLRPYGYFGAVAGVVVGSVVVSSFFRIDPWRLAAAFCVTAPWIVVAGRLRCLVQGCCHGGPAPSWLGIRYDHPASRVCRLAGMAGLPLHPTPLYSILWNVALAFLLLRLWIARAPLAIVVGAYFTLAGLGRFVEEAYRGEPQTPVRWGLRLYQWLAAASVLVGALATIARTRPADGSLSPSPITAVAAAAFGVLGAIAYGVDFPESKSRFSRLT